MTVIEEYINTCEPEIRDILFRVREVIRENAKEAEEKISWDMPTFYLNGNLVHFFAFKKHIGFYPGDSGVAAFTEKFKEMGLKYSKGAVQFPLANPIPYQLIAEITRFRVQENLSKAPQRKSRVRTKMQITEQVQQMIDCLLTSVEDIGTFKIEEKSAYSTLANGLVFLTIHPKKKWLDINIISPGPISDSRIIKTEQPSKNRCANTFRLTCVEDIDQLLMEHIREAYFFRK